MPSTVALSRLYLVSGAVDPEKGVLPGTLELVTNRLVVMRDHKGAPSLNYADSRGLLVSIGAKGEQLHPVQRDATRPLQLSLAPAGTIKESVAAYGEGWQQRLVGHLREAGVATEISTIPIKFTEADLQPAQTEEEKQAMQGFSKGEFRGQLIPKVRCLLILIEEGAAKHPPANLEATCDGKKVPTKALPNLLNFSLPGKGAGAFHVVAAIAPDLKEGRYHVSLPAHTFRHARCHDNRGMVHRTFEVAFAIKNTFFDIDVHVFEMPTVESAILMHFGDRYPHMAPVEADEAPVYEAGLNSVARARANALVYAAKKELVVGLLPSEGVHEGVKGQLTNYLLSLADVALKEYLPTLNATPMQANALALLLQGYQGYRAYTKGYEGWKLARKKLQESLVAVFKQQGRVFPLETLDTIDLLFKPNAWKTIQLHLRQAASEAKYKVLFKAHLIKKSSLPPLLWDRLEQEAFNKAMRGFSAMKAASGVLTAIDVALTIDSAAKAAGALADAKGSEELQSGRLRTAAKRYADSYGAAPNMAAQAKLEALRMLANAARAGVDEAEVEILKQGAAAAMGAVTLVPVVGEAAAVVAVAGVAKDLAFQTVGTISDAIDRFGFRHRAQGSRLLDLARQHSLAVRALPTKPTKNDPMVAWQSRVIAIIGLLRLIERLGGSQSNSQRFNAKVKDYRIQEYINAYILNPKRFGAMVSTGTPLDELWLYACGNKDVAWNEQLMNVLEAKDHSWHELEESGGHYAEFGQQHWFPIEGVATTVGELAHAFSLDFSGVVDKQFAWARVYVMDRTSKRWVTIERASFAIGPRDAIRVVAAFRAKSPTDNLTGVPVSLQLVRTDGLSNDEGPVYKTSLSKVLPAVPWALGKGDDKDLLQDELIERQVAADPLAYVAVFFPFYYHRQQRFSGLKPFGHIPLSGDPSYTVAFQIAAGEDAKRIEKGGKKLEAKVHIDLKNGTEVGMLLNRDFLKKKTAEKAIDNIFDFPYQSIVPLGAVARIDGTWVEADENAEALSFKAVWGKPFDLVFVFGARFANTLSLDPSNRSFPAQLQVRQVHTFVDDHGPSYPTKVVCIDPQPRHGVQHWTEIKTRIAALDASAGKDLSDLTNKDFQFRMKEEMLVFASYTSLRFCIESKDGKTMITIPGLKPFADDLSSRLTFGVGLNPASQIGLGSLLRTAFTIEMPLFDKAILAGTAFEGDPSFVTDKRYHSALEVDKVTTR